MATRPPARPGLPARRRSRAGLFIHPARGRRSWVRLALIALAVLVVIGTGVGSFYWVKYGRLIDSKLGGEQRPAPRIFGRAFTLRPGAALSPAQLVQRLNDVGYAERPKVENPGEFSAQGNTVIVGVRPVGQAKPQTVRADFSRGASPVVTKLTLVGGGPVDTVALEAPLLTALAPGEKRRYVPLSRVPKVMVNAVISIEDKRFFDHPGVDVIRAVGALLTNLRGDKPYLVGGSTLTQQIVKNTFLTPEKTLKRKVQEQFMALVLESRFTKDQILELYLNDVTLGQRGPFEIHGVAEAARIFFGKDVSNLTLAEAATIAGVIQAPSHLSPFRNPDRARDRRNIVLAEMAGAGYISKDDAMKAAAEPLKVAARALENEAPYFVDYVSQLVDDEYGGALKKDAAVDVYTTLDLQLQRIAQEAVGDGIAQVDKQLAARKKPGQAEAALLAVDPRTGEILAFVGGRAYFQSQFDRVVAAKRQPGSVFKPFVYLAAFERMASEGRSDLTPATVVVDEPTTFKDGENDYTPANYQNEYDGPITLRRALALSRNIVAIKVAEITGYDRVANLWKRVDVGTPARPYPSIALGVFEATPFDMATAYTLFPNGGQIRPLTAITTVVENGKPRGVVPVESRLVARADTTFLVTNMMRSVIDEGTGAGARANGFTFDAAGKSGTTNDLRDAWFIGFTPELLTVVWVGFDNNQPIGLSGSQAALPIWTTFMKRALAGHKDAHFEPPDDIVFVDIDKDTGKLARPGCPKVISEAFLMGTQPKEYCDVHGGHAVAWLSRLGAALTHLFR
ncbi:MAG TPA: PBP1A family penicillin-binding protein [Vicinamibacterales bacterium]|nr:PBP1A family penicillin-binding protein [Vicinamibacterales bacterium]